MNAQREIGLPVTATIDLSNIEWMARRAKWFVEHEYNHDAEKALAIIEEMRATLNNAEAAIKWDGSDA